MMSHLNRFSPRPMRLARAIALTAILAAPTVASARQVPAAAIAVVINGEPFRGNLQEVTDGAARELFEYLSRQLPAHGFLLLRSSDPNELIGGELLADQGLGRLEITTRGTSFEFRVLLLPRAKAGDIKLLHPRSGAVMWERGINVHSGVPEGKARHETALREASKILDELRPKPGLRIKADPFLAGLVSLNDPALADERFLERAHDFAAAEKVFNAGVLLDLACDARTAGSPDLRTALLRRAIQSQGVRMQPALARALVREVRANPAGSPLMDLLIEGLQLIGASPGDALAPELLKLPLDALLEGRARFSFRDRRDEVDARIEQLSLASIRASRDFDSAESRLERLPLERFSDQLRAELRGELMARVTVDNATADLARVAAVFPEDRESLEQPAHLDRTFLRDAQRLKQAPEHVRRELLRQYQRCVPEGDASEPMIRSLGLENVLAAELRARLSEITSASGISDGTRETGAVAAVYGTRPGPLARATLARVLSESLGEKPRPEDLVRLAARHPELPELDAEARRQGAIRDRSSHVMRLALGDGEERFYAEFGKNGIKRGSLNRRDLSPAAYLGTGDRLAKLDSKGYFALELPGRCRALFKDGRAFRIVLSDLGGRFHHGVRPGDLRKQARDTLGEPDSTRALLFDREILTWNGFDGGRSSLSAIFDGNKIAFLFEEDPVVARGIVAALR